MLGVICGCACWSVCVCLLCVRWCVSGVCELVCMCFGVHVWVGVICWYVSVCWCVWCLRVCWCMCVGMSVSWYLCWCWFVYVFLYLCVGVRVGVCDWCVCVCWCVSVGDCVMLVGVCVGWLVFVLVGLCAFSFVCWHLCVGVSVC